MSKISKEERRAKRAERLAKMSSAELEKWKEERRAKRAERRKKMTASQRAERAEKRRARRARRLQEEFIAASTAKPIRGAKIIARAHGDEVARRTAFVYYYSGVVGDLPLHVMRLAASDYLEAGYRPTDDVRDIPQRERFTGMAPEHTKARLYVPTQSGFPMAFLGEDEASRRLAERLAKKGAKFEENVMQRGIKPSTRRER